MNGFNNSSNYPNISDNAMEMENKPFVNTKNEGVEFNPKNYLDTKIGKGEKSKKLKIRLLPIDSESNTPFKHVYVHNVKVPKEISERGWKNYICLEKTEGIDHEKYGHECPFCKLNREAYKMASNCEDPIEKRNYTKISLDNRAKESIIMRCVERGKENEGVKFWKHNVWLDKGDPYNQIMALYRLRKEEGEENGTKVNILDLYDGKDLTVEFTIPDDAVEKKTDNRPNIKITDSSISTPLAKDTQMIKELVSDKKKWNDVFAVKDYDYLSLIIEGKTPYKLNGKWVDRETVSKNYKSENLKKQEDFNIVNDEISKAEERFK